MLLSALPHSCTGQNQAIFVVCKKKKTSKVGGCAHLLCSFLEYFRNKLHEEIPGSTLLWYDSLTKNGAVDWQNQLTEENLPFFKVSDGIFLNYWWRVRRDNVATS